MSKLQGVEKTLYIPLTARIYVSKRFPEYFYDELALSLEKELPDNTIEKNSSEYYMMASVARNYNFDRIAKEFIQKNGRCNIVNLGAGLETMSNRINDKNATFYELDLPEVIKDREKALGKLDNEIFLSCSMFEYKWMNEINKNVPSLFIVSGVFQYFHEKEIVALIKEMQKQFPNSELIFDVMNASSLKIANRYVRKTGNKNAMMYFSIDDPKEFSKKYDIELIDSIPFYTDARKILKGKLKLYTRIAMMVLDYKGGRLLHFNLGGKHV